MPEFSYTARTMEGTKVSGTMSANSERDVLGALSHQSLFPISVDMPKTPKSFSLGGGRISDLKVAQFYEQLAALMNNGMPMLRSMSILRTQTKVPLLEKTLDDVINRVEDGQSLCDAFAKHPKVFSDMAVNMARAGEEGGFLEDALARVAKFTEQTYELKSKTVGAMIYPAILFSMGGLIVSVLLVYFVPNFEPMFKIMRAKGNLPQVTEILMTFSKQIQFWAIPILVLALFAFVMIRSWLEKPQGKRFFDLFKIRLPLLGGVFLNLAVARFCRVLGTLLTNGVPILKALDISRDAAGNRILSEAIAKASENITAGESLSIPLKKSGHFPHDVTEMISVAEESNSLDTVLVNISENLEKQTVRRLDLVVKLIEPIMLMVMAAVVLFVVVSLLLPIMNMGTALE